MYTNLLESLREKRGADLHSSGHGRSWWECGNEKNRKSGLGIKIHEKKVQTQ